MKKIKQPHGGAIVHAEKGETANKNGRPKKLLSSLLAEIREAGYESVKAVNIVESYETLLGLDEAQLNIIGEDIARPMLVRIVARAMLKKDRFGNGLGVLETLLDRVHGRPTQKVIEEVKSVVTISEKKKPILAQLIGMRKKS